MSADAPETPRQAARWQEVNGQAVRFGLCPRCASQMAWGSQLGYARTTREPCETCAPLVALLPLAKPNGWRTVSGSATARAPWATVSGSEPCPRLSSVPTPGHASAGTIGAVALSRAAA